MPALRLPTATLRFRLIRSLGAMLVPLLVLGAAGAVTNERAARAGAASGARVVADLGVVSSLRADMDIAERAGEELAATGDPSAQRRFVDAGRRIERTLEELARWEDADVRASAPDIAWDWRRAEQVVPALATGGDRRADPRARARFSWAMTRAHERLGDLHELGLEEIERRQEALQRTQRRQLMGLVVLLVAAGLVALWLAGRLYRMLSAPLRDLEAAARAYGEGDFGRRVPVGGSGPEFAAVGAAFNAMAAQLVEGRERLAHQAGHDPLTGLPNRRVFLERTSGAVGRKRPAVLFIDLDDFKAVNDSLGHTAGDVLLEAVGRRLQETVRPGDLVARLGGDEFAVLLPDAAGAPEAERIADRIRLALAVPLDIAGRHLQVRASVGVAAGLETAGTLLRNADIAMYEAKAAGKDARRTFEPDMHRRAAARLEFESRLREALVAGEFELHYQPVVDLHGGPDDGAEALVRWRHPTRGLLGPGEFIPAAERSGIIVELGSWILREACAFGARLGAEHGRPPIVGVNLSACQLEAPGLIDDVRRHLDATGMDPRCLVLEITETTVARDLEATADVLERLRDLGVRIAMDDFGTGYSSLAILHRLPVDILKIDRAFVRHVEGAPRERSLVEAIVALSAALGTVTVAEGVEQPSQAEALRALGCDRAQGFHFARPLPADAAAAYLAPELRRAPTSQPHMALRRAPAAPGA